MRRRLSLLEDGVADCVATAGGAGQNVVELGIGHAAEEGEVLEETAIQGGRHGALIRFGDDGTIASPARLPQSASCRTR